MKLKGIFRASENCGTCLSALIVFFKSGREILNVFRNVEMNPDFGVPGGGGNNVLELLSILFCNGCFKGVKHASLLSVTLVE